MDLRSRFLQPRPPPLAQLCRRDVIPSSRSSACMRPGNSCFAEFSAYELRDGTRIWIITEADRSVTTILLPEEYC